MSPVEHTATAAREQEQDEQEPRSVRRITLALAGTVVGGALAGVGAVALLFGGPTHPSAGSAGSTTALTSSVAHRPEARASGATPGVVSASAPGLPTGTTLRADPAGFALPVPADWTRSTDNGRIYYISPDGAYRIGIHITPISDHGALGELQSESTQNLGPDPDYPGYHDYSVQPTAYRGFTDAAIWQWTWSGYNDGFGQRHSKDLCWDENGTSYDIWVSAPLTRSNVGAAYFASVAAGFQVG